MTIQEKINKIVGDRPNSLAITFNDHWICYRPLDDVLAEIEDDDFAGPGERQKCIDSGNLWDVSCYPHTPVGHVTVYASTLEAALDGTLRQLGR